VYARHFVAERIPIARLGTRACVCVCVCVCVCYELREHRRARNRCGQSDGRVESLATLRRRFPAGRIDPSNVALADIRRARNVNAFHRRAGKLWSPLSRRTDGAVGRTRVATNRGLLFVASWNASDFPPRSRNPGAETREDPRYRASLIRPFLVSRRTATDRIINCKFVKLNFAAGGCRLQISAIAGCACLQGRARVAASAVAPCGFSALSVIKRARME